MITQFRAYGVCMSVFATLCFGTAVPAKPVMMGQPARLTEPTGGFSYLPPPGWKIRTFPGLKYRISYTMSVGFAPNINVIDETVAAPLGQYMQMSLGPMKQTYTNLHVLSQVPFTTSSGLPGMRMAVDGTVTGRHLRQIFYVFAAPSNRKIVVTASWLASDGDKYAKTTDASLKTFKLL